MKLLARLRGAIADRDVQHLAANSMWSSMATLSRTVVGVVQVGMITRLLGAATYGRIALVMSVTAFVQLVFSVRVWEVVTKRFTDARIASDREAAAAVLVIGSGLSLLVGLATSALVIATAPWSAAWFLGDASLATEVRIFALTVVVSWPNDTATAALRTLDQFRFLATFTVVGSLFRLATLAAILVTLRGLTGVVWSYVFTETILALFLVWKLSQQFRRALGGAWWRVTRGAVTKEWAGMRQMLFYSFGISTLRAFGSQADLLLLGYWRPAVEVGYYKCATQFTDLGNRLASSVLMAAYPAFSRLSAENDVDGLLRLVRRATGLAVALLIPACALLTLAAPLLIWAMAGPAFEPAVPMLRVVSWSLLWAVTFWVIPLPMSIGKASWAFEITLVTTVLRVACVTFSIYYGGALGLSLALAAYSLLFVGVSFFYLARAARWLRATQPVTS